MIFLVSVCVFDLIRAPMETTAAEEERGNGKHDSFLCLEVGRTQVMTMEPPNTL